MRKGIILLTILIISVFAQSQSPVDILHYRFHIGLNDSNDTLYGLAVINFISIEKTNSFSLDMNTKIEEGKGLQVISVKLNDAELKKTQLSYQGDKIIFKELSLNKGDSSTLAINYKGIAANGLIISKNKFGHRTFFADNWPDQAHYWIPCKDDPIDKASVEFIVTAPEHYQVVANGVQVEESSLNNGFKTTHWKEDVSLPTKVMTLGVADFAVNLAGTVNGCIPVTSWVFPEDRDKGFYDLEIAKDILSWFIDYVGPYGYKKLANVQSKTKFGGLENANTIFYSQDIVTGDRSREGTIAHEIAHQWFGNMATEKSFAHLWLSEGFATYFTTLYFENKEGKSKAKELREEDRQQVIAFSKSDQTAVVNTSETDYMNLLNPNSYQKGGWMLHMLRVQAGDSLFRKIIRKYYAAFAGKNADTGDFQKIAEEVSGKDLSGFFRQWLYTTGQPSLNIKWKYNPKEKNILLTVEQLQKKTFSFPLEIAFKEGTENTRRKLLNVSKATEVFKIPVSQKPSIVEADPDINLLFEGKVSEEK